MVSARLFLPFVFVSPFTQAAALLEEMHSAGIEPYPPAHHEAITAIAAAEGYDGALTVLARMKVG